MVGARARDCTTAVAAFEGVIRRQREPAVQDAAREGISLCALIEGQRLLEAGKPADAESWFRRATAPGAPPEVTRGAFLGLGDVRLAHGDGPRALESHQQALGGGAAGDTTTPPAPAKINARRNAGGAPAPPNPPRG